jgi:hypothetical protein
LAALLVAGVGFNLDAALYVSNLTNRFDNGIGIISSLLPGEGYFLGSFTTGGGSYALNSVVLEFYAYAPLYGPNSWTNIDADLYQVIGNQPLPIVPLGRPTTNSMPTQWPQDTAFIDFHPNWQTGLQPFTQYQIALRAPVENPAGAGLLFCVVSNYASLARWQMGPGLLKLAVDATLVEDQFTYATNNGALTIVSYVGAGGDVSIPDTIYGMPVVSIGQAAFSNSSNLLSVSIPNTVTSLENDAFISCSSLVDFFVPDSVTNIGSSVFQSCTSLTNVTVGAGVQAIGDGAFDFCSNLITITVNPLNVTYSSVNGVVLNQAQTTLIRYPEGNTGSYTIPNGITNVGNAAFANCRMTNIIIPGSVISLSNGAFAGCTNLTSLTIPGSVTSLGASAFAHCSSLTSTIIGSGVTTIGDRAFFYCEGLAQVTIPRSVTQIGQDVFSRCTRFTAITVDSLNPAYSSVDGVLFNKNQSWLLVYPEGKAGSYAMPSSVTVIGTNAFQFCTNLTSVTLDSNVTSIEQNAFAYCSDLNSLTIPASTTNIGDGAFLECTLLTNAAIYGSLGSLPNSMFWNCVNLATVTIPNGVTSIGDGTFYSCRSLTNFTIPSDATNIGNQAFLGCFSLSDITIPPKAMSIGSNTFAFCFGLTSIIIPNSVNSIGEYAFQDCYRVAKITIGNELADIRAGAFADCFSLTSVYFRGNVPASGSLVFDSTDNATVYYLPGTTGWSNNFAGRPALLWNPIAITGEGVFGIRSNQFGFNITGTPSIPVLVEGTTNLARPSWVPLKTIGLTNGSFYFQDSKWMNYPARIYRLRSP